MQKRSIAAKVQCLWPITIVGGCFLIGGVLGCFFTVAVTGESADQLRSFLTDYIFLSRDALSKTSVWHAVWSEGRWLLFCVLFGLTGIGIVVLPVLFLFRGFLFAFGTGCFVRFLGMMGIIPACVVFGAPALFWMPALFLCGVKGFEGGLKRLKCGSEIPFAVLKGYDNQCAGIAVSVLFLFLCVFFECSLLPVLLPMAVRILG